MDVVYVIVLLRCRGLELTCVEKETVVPGVDMEGALESMD